MKIPGDLPALDHLEHRPRAELKVASRREHLLDVLEAAEGEEVVLLV